MKQLASSLAIAMMVIILAACSSAGDNPADVALQAAKAYYEQLIHGDCESYVEGTLKGDTVPTAMRQQLVLNMRMYLEKQKEAHRGIDSVVAVRATCDTVRLPNDSLQITANAFLSLCYTDSTKEEILVPMILKKGIWYLH